MKKEDHVKDLEDLGDALEELRMNKMMKMGEKENTEDYSQVSMLTMMLNKKQIQFNFNKLKSGSYYTKLGSFDYLIITFYLNKNHSLKVLNAVKLSDCLFFNEIYF